MSNVAELRQALGTSNECPSKKVLKVDVTQPEPTSDKNKVQEDITTDELVYKDSSTFLKVCIFNPYN